MYILVFISVIPSRPTRSTPVPCKEVYNSITPQANQYSNFVQSHSCQCRTVSWPQYGPLPVPSPHSHHSAAKLGYIVLRWQGNYYRTPGARDTCVTIVSGLECYKSWGSLHFDYTIDSKTHRRTRCPCLCFSRTRPWPHLCPFLLACQL